MSALFLLLFFVVLKDESVALDAPGIDWAGVFLSFPHLCLRRKLFCSSFFFLSLEREAAP